MWKHLVTRGPAQRRRTRRDWHSRGPACGLTVEALEGRLLLSGDMVIRWNEAVGDALASFPAPIPGFGARIEAIVQAAVYEAVNSIDGTHTPYLVDIPSPHFASKEATAAEEAAAATAAHDALVGIFPAQKLVFDLELKASLQDIDGGDPKTWGIRVGQAAAQIILA